MENLGRTQVQYVKTEVDGFIVRMIVDHLEKRNALSKQLVDRIVDTLNRFSDERTRAVVGIWKWSLP